MRATTTESGKATQFVGNYYKILSSPFTQFVLYAGGFVERNGFNCVEGFWKRMQATLFCKG